MFPTPANTGHLNNVLLMLDHRLRRWPNIRKTLFQCPVLDGTEHVILFLLVRRSHRIHETWAQGWFSAGPTVSHHWTNVGPMLTDRLRRWPNIGSGGMFGVFCVTPSMRLLSRERWYIYESVISSTTYYLGRVYQVLLEREDSGVKFQEIQDNQI